MGEREKERMKEPLTLKLRRVGHEWMRIFKGGADRLGSERKRENEGTNRMLRRFKPFPLPIKRELSPISTQPKRRRFKPFPLPIKRELSPIPTQSKRYKPIPRPIKLEPDGEPLTTLHQLDDFDPSLYARLLPQATSTFKGGVVTEKSYKIDIHRPIPGTNELLLARTLAVLHYAVADILRRASPESIGQLFVSNDKMYSEVRASRRMPVRELDFNDLMDTMAAVIQSSKSRKQGNDSDDDDDDESVVHLEDSVWTLVTFKPRLLGAIFSRKELDLGTSLKASRSIIDPSRPSYKLPKNLAQSCLLVCVAVGELRLGLLAASEGRRISHLHEFIRKNCPARVAEIAEAAHLNVQGPHRLTDLQAIQAVLGERYQICVYRSQDAPIASYGEDRAELHINLLLREDIEGESVISEAPGGPKGHIMLISSMGPFVGSPGFCELCKKGTSRRAKNRHRCTASSCSLCMAPDCLNEVSDIPRQMLYKQCEECALSFATECCYDAHLESRCARFKRCQRCWAFCQRDKFDAHFCGRPYCGHCQSYHSPIEWCSVRPVRNKSRPSEESMWASSEDEGEAMDEREEIQEDEREETDVIEHEEQIEDSDAEEEETKTKKSKSRCYADAETYEDPITGDLRANLVVVEKVVDGEEVERFIFAGNDAMEQFTRKCIQEKSPFENSYMIWHNASGFDAHLWYRELLRLEMPPKIILRGQKIMSMKLRQNRIVCRDSLLYLPNTPLRAFAGIFGLPEGKTDFPHMLNTPEWIDWDNMVIYKGEDGSRFPPLSAYQPKVLRPSERKRLAKWHAEEAERYANDPTLEFCPAAKLLEYCCTDVATLRLGFECFRQSWLDEYGDMDPLEQLTFPAFNNALLRTKFMKRNTISLINPQGYGREGNRPASKEAFGWMDLEMEKLKRLGDPVVEMRDGRRGGEVRICGVRLDGWAKTASGRFHAYLYHGCRWHGCVCQGPDRTPEDLASFMRTELDTERLRRLGQSRESPYPRFQLHVIWSHEFTARLSHSAVESERYALFKKSWPKEGLEPRKAFFGGRCNAIKHSIPNVDIEGGQRLLYYDFSSLYPAVGYSVDGQKWPVGPPTIRIGLQAKEETPPLDQAFGLWSTTIHPPKRLLHPVIGQAHHSKLLFALCTKCSKELNYTICHHTKKQRAMKSVFFTEELKLAVEMGYTVERPTESWDWAPEKQTTRLFRSFMRKQFAKKAKASPVPADPVKMAALIQELKDTVGISLRPEDFEPSSTRRALAKFSMNNVQTKWRMQSSAEFCKVTCFEHNGTLTCKVSTDKEPHAYASWSGDSWVARQRRRRW